MSRSKEEKALIPKYSSNIFGHLDHDVAGAIANHLPVKELLNLMFASIMTYNLFRPKLNMLLAFRARVCVVQGDADNLALIAKHKPAVLFDKGQVTDPRGRIFSHVSAYQLLIFLCDKNMKDKIKRLIPANLTTIRQAQEAEVDKGGVDLIKLDFDPLLMKEQNFKSITEFKTAYTLFDGTQQEVNFSLLENPDGIIYYQDDKNVVHFYYANQTTKEIKKLNVCLNSEEDAKAWDAFKASFKDMENNAGRRSSDAEHQLIEKTLKCSLQRKGIQYEHNGIRYRDSRSTFRLINAYRIYIRLCDEAEQNDQRDKAHTYWREGVGKAQGEEMWLLQRICEKGRPFHPFPVNFNDFKREATFYNFHSGKEEFVFVDGKLVVGLGSDFALYKAWRARARAVQAAGAAMVDLIAAWRFIEDAKANIIELEQVPEPNLQASPKLEKDCEISLKPI